VGEAQPGRRGLTRDPEGKGTYSPTGIWGDPTLATREKGKLITALVVREIVGEVTNFIIFI
jgi:creatinine amidohydrolase